MPGPIDGESFGIVVFGKIGTGEFDGREGFATGPCRSEAVPGPTRTTRPLRAVTFPPLLQAWYAFLRHNTRGESRESLPREVTETAPTKLAVRDPQLAEGIREGETLALREIRQQNSPHFRADGLAAMTGRNTLPTSCDGAL